MNILVKTLFASMLLSTVGCVQLPTEESGVNDLKPGISFSMSNLVDADVLVDGQNMGKVANYQDGKARLNLLSGTHKIMVVQGGKVLLQETIYLGDGVNKTLRVN